MKRGYLNRRVPIRKRNPKRAQRAFERNFGDYADWIRSLCCWFCGRAHGIEAAHMVKRSRGSDKSTLLPACSTCHRFLEDRPAVMADYLPVALSLYQDWEAKRTDERQIAIFEEG